MFIWQTAILLLSIPYTVSTALRYLQPLLFFFLQCLPYISWFIFQDAERTSELPYYSFFWCEKTGGVSL
jgi:hypothetical protein